MFCCNVLGYGDPDDDFVHPSFCLFSQGPNDHFDSPMLGPSAGALLTRLCHLTGYLSFFDSHFGRSLFLNVIGASCWAATKYEKARPTFFVFVETEDFFFNFTIYFHIWDTFEPMVTHIFLCQLRKCQYPIVKVHTGL